LLYLSGMTFAEKKLYHQIHPLKLGTDIFASVISLFLFWYHYFLPALMLHFLLPVLGSFLVITYSNLDKQKRSKLGRHIKKHMTSSMEMLRLSGDIITIFGAWYHNLFVIIAGLLIVLGGWMGYKLLITLLLEKFHRGY